MTKWDEYRTNAQECERMAENSLNPSDKAAWHHLAKRWLCMIPTGTALREAGFGVEHARIDDILAPGRIGLFVEHLVPCAAFPSNPLKKRGV
jgi:hypothetical protein